MDDSVKNKTMILTPMDGQISDPITVTGIPEEISFSEVLENMGAVSVTGDEENGLIVDFGSPSQENQNPTFGYTRKYGRGYDQIDWKN